MLAFFKQCGKRVLLIASLWMPVAPIVAVQVATQKVETVQNKKTKKRVQDMNVAEKLWVCTKGVARWSNPLNYKKKVAKLLNGVKKVEFFETPSNELARYAYNTGPYGDHPVSSIAGRNEYNDLLLTDLSASLSSNAITGMGSYAMTHLLTRTDRRETELRQQQIKRLVEDDELYFNVEKQLKRFARHQNQIYNYWDDNITVTRNGKTHFFAQVENLQRIILFHWLNMMLPALIANTVSSSCNDFVEQYRSPKMLGANAWLCLVCNTPLLWLQAGVKGMADGLKSHFFGVELRGKHPLNSFVEGVESFNNTYGFLWHSDKPYQNVVTEIANYKKKINEGDQDEIARAETQLIRAMSELSAKGTPKDLITFSKERGPDASIDLQGMGRGLKWVTSYVPSFIKYWFAMGYFKENGTFVWGSKEDDSIGSINISRLWRMLGSTYDFATTRFIVVSSQILHSICGSLRNYEAWSQLDTYVKKVEVSFQAMNAMRSLLCADSCFKESGASSLFEKTFSKPSTFMKELTKIMNERRSPRQRAKQWGGRSLIEHNLMQSLKPQVQPALWGVAELDALYAIAKMIRIQDEAHPMCFVEFLPESYERAALVIKEGVLPMVDNSVPNDAHLAEGHPNKMVVSGPNGAGKSIYLKMMGCNVLMAQSLGVAAARSMKCCWFNTLRTCINPSEKVNQLSKLQAEKVRLDGIFDEYDYQVKHNPNHRELIITDEPLSGTTNKIAGRFIYEYGQQIGEFPGLAFCMATHNEKPTELEQNGCYSNYQVGMRINEKGFPEATFKITPGIPHWWFSSDPEDMKQQDAFVRYTVAQKHQQELVSRHQEIQKNMQFIAEKLSKRDYSSKQERMTYKLHQRMLERELSQLDHEMDQASEKLRSWVG